MRSTTEISARTGAAEARAGGIKLWRIGAWILAAAVSAGAGLWFVGQSRAESRARDEGRLRDAARTLRARLVSEQGSLLSHARLLRDDSRVREPLATTGVDDATIADILGDLRSSSGYALLAILTPAGAVRTVSGLDALKGAELGSSAVLRRAREEDGATDVWTFPEQLLAVAAAPVRLGGGISAFLLLGAALDPGDLFVVEPNQGLEASLLVGGKLARAEELPEASRALIIAGAALAPEQTLELPGAVSALARVSELDPSRGGKVLWILRRPEAAARAELALLAPLFACLLGLAGELSLGRRP